MTLQHATRKGRNQKDNVNVGERDNGSYMIPFPLAHTHQMCGVIIRPAESQSKQK